MAKTFPLVTIGMPIFNGGKYLHQALDSLIAQDYRNINIIISDNASNDETEVICRDYASKHKNIVYVRNRKNIGAFGNFRKVLRQATGEYFMWAAADDLWAPTFVSTLVHELETHPNAGVAMCAVELTDEMSQATGTVRFDGEANPNFLNHRDLLIAITDYGLKKKKYNYFIYGLFRRELISKATRFFPNVFAADRILMCELALATQFRYVNEILHFRRIHSVNVYERYPSEKFSRAYKLDKDRYKAIRTLGLKLLVSPIVPLRHKRYISLALQRFRDLIEQNIRTERKLLMRRMKDMPIRSNTSSPFWKPAMRKMKRYLSKAKGLFLPRQQPLTLWGKILENSKKDWSKSLRGSDKKVKVLLAPTMGGFQQGVLLESVLAAALNLRNAQTDILLCDSFLPACQLTEIGKTAPEHLLSNSPQARCSTCAPEGKALITPLGLPVQWLSHLVSAEKYKLAQELSSSIPFEQIGEYQLDGLAVGEHAQAGALRYFARGDYHAEPMAEQILRHYLKAAFLTVFATRELLRQNKYDVAVFNHGLYVPQGLIGEVCRQEGVRVVNWNPAYRKHCFIFSPGDTYHHTMIAEPTTSWENIPWTPEIEKQTMDYLKSRWQGTGDWIWFHDEPEEDIAKIAQETGANPELPWIGLFTNVMWDAQLHYRSNAFPSMLDWVLQTIAYFSRHPELQLLIRIHPAELRGGVPSRQPLVAEINKAFPQLPPNVFVIPPESQISTYAVAERCNAALIYNTKTGIEISSMGIPVVVAGEAWIRGKGFSMDASSPQEYFQILDRLPLSSRLSLEQLERARKYAFHFFFRRMIPLPFITPTEKNKFGLAIEKIFDLDQGKFPGLDVVCDGILNNSPFIYPAENILEAF